MASLPHSRVVRALVNVAAWDAVGIQANHLHGAGRRRLYRTVRAALDPTGLAADSAFTSGLTPFDAAVRTVFETPAGERWLRALAGVALPDALADRLDVSAHDGLNKWIAAAEPAVLRSTLAVAIRLAIDRTGAGDSNQLDRYYKDIIRSSAMATIYYIDATGIPPLATQKDQDDYLKAVKDLLTKTFGMAANSADPETSPTAAAIVGMVLLDEEYDTTTLSFQESMKKAWLESLNQTTLQDPQKTTPNASIYELVSIQIPLLNGGKDQVSYQQVAAVSRYVIDHTDTIPFDHPNINASVRLGLDSFVGNRPTGDSLTLPAGALPSSPDDSADNGELVGPNIAAFGTVYALALLERTGVIAALDRVSELFQHGMIPVAHDAAGKALDNYFWTVDFRMKEAERLSHYGRILGLQGGQVPRETQPNIKCEELFMRFVASVSEWDRQRRVADILDTRRRSLSLTGEQVRKTGRDLAANASLYGWASTHFVARRVNQHLQTAMDILGQPQLQKAFGVTGAWQLVERVAMTELNMTPNITRYRTMADATKSIFDLLSRKTRELSLSTSGKPFLSDDPSGTGNGDIGAAETDQLARSVEHILAVSGVADDQVVRMSAPHETTAAPSLPSVGLRGGADGDMAEKLRKLVAGGSVPSLDQLQQLLPH